MVREYLSSLKEDKELDYLFPVLLNLMGFKIIATPKESKGQPQYGKDIVAIGKDPSGNLRRFYFELKGGSDKDIDDVVMTKRDGIMESFRAAKYTGFTDSSIRGFNTLPKQYVLVHNGTIQSNTRPVLEGFIKQEFPDGNFEKWDIYALTDLFSQYLFGEYLLTDEESIRLFKRTLVLLDAPDYDFVEFEKLIELQISKVTNLQGSRSLTKFFATMNLLTVVLIHYSKENDNLHAAKNAITSLLLKVWHWILENKLERKKPILKEFNKLLALHSDLLDEYFNKLLPIACQPNGLYSEIGRGFEAIGAPLRSFEFISWLICHFERLEYPESLKADKTSFNEMRRQHKDIVKKVIENNISCKTPIVDNQNIAISIVFIYYIKYNDLSEEDLQFIGEYSVELLDKILITKTISGRFPEFYSNIPALIEYLSTRQRPPEYEDSSSLLITLLFELLIVLNGNDIYTTYWPEFAGKINLQMADCTMTDEDFELALFKQNLNNAYYTDANINLPEQFGDFKNIILNDKRVARIYRTDQAGYPFLRLFAHVYFKNDLLPLEWRKFIS